MTLRHAVALSGFSSAGVGFLPGKVIFDLPLNQFTDWSAPGVDLVRAATDEEVAAAREDTAFMASVIIDPASLAEVEAPEDASVAEDALAEPPAGDGATEEAAASEQPATDGEADTHTEAAPRRKR